MTGMLEEQVDPSYKWKVLGVVGSGVYMVTLDAGIVNVALPVLTREFNAPLTDIQWVILAYVLCITGLLLPAGRLADMLGRREVFLGGFILFGAASALCGVAPTVPLLVGARVLQGVAGALMQANMAALLTQAFPARERGRTLGLNSSIVSSGLLSGPVIGGIITEQLGWRWAFFINVPISVVAMFVGLRLLRHTPVNRNQRFDLAGAALFLLAVVALLLGLNQGESWGWASPLTLACFGAAVASAVAFIWVERRVDQPTVDLDLFRNRGFSASAAAAFLSFLAISPVTLLMPFYFQLVLGLPVGQSGLLLAVIPATVALLAPVSGSLSDRFGSRAIASAGMAIQTAGMLSLVFLPVQGAALDAVVRLVVMGVGMAIFMSPNASAMFGSVPRSRLGLVGGFQALTRNLGQSIGQAAAGAMWSVVTLGAVAGLAGAAGTAGAAVAAQAAVQAPPEAMMVGLRAVFAVSVALSVVAMLTSFFGRPTGEPRAQAA